MREGRTSSYVVDGHRQLCNGDLRRGGLALGDFIVQDVALYLAQGILWEFGEDVDTAGDFVAGEFFAAEGL